LEVHGKVHAPATIPRGKTPPLPTESDAGWAGETHSRRLGEGLLLLASRN